jgi:murein DD-endopeptidase MepM/ murein hydrolase activator NlpD
VKADPNATSHTVARGQTLTQIAKAYDVSVSSLVDINSIANPNAVEVGTKLLLRQSSSTSNAPLQTQSVPETVSEGQPSASEGATPSPTNSSTASVSTTSVSTSTTSTEVAASTASTSKPTTAQAAKANTSQSTLIAKASTTPAASVAPQDADWRSYGPLKVDWGNWQTMAGSEVAPTLNAEGQPLYVAVNCDARKINVTGANGAWKTWSSPQNDYEQDLVKDRCSK